MRQPRSRLVLLVCLGLTATLAMACGSSEPSKGANGLEKASVTVASLPLLDVAGLHIAVKRKLFEAEGLHVRIKPITQSIAALPALKNGQVDVIAGGNYVSFLQAYRQGAADLRIIADCSGQAPRFMQLLTMPDSPIRQPRDLAGRTVAVNILNNIQSLTLNEILRAANVDPSTVKYRAIPFPQMGAALQKHEVDAVHTGEPFGTEIQRELGARMVVDGGGAPVTGLPVSGYFTTDSFVRKNPKTAAAFQRALQKAQALASADRKNVEEVLPGYVKVDPKIVSRLVMPEYPTSLDPVRLQRLPDLMLKDGLLKSRVDMKDLIFTPTAR